MTTEQQLPEGWKTQPLQNLLSYVIGGDWGKDENYDDENFILVNCIRGAEFRNWKNDKASTAALRKIKISSLQNRQIQENDILIEISGGGPEQPVGRTALITKQVLSNFNNPVVCTNFLRLIRPNEKINSTFLNYYLSYFYLSGKVIAYQAGSNNLRNLKFKEYERIGIPIPPIETQQAIVNKIESLFDEIDEGIGRLKTAAQQIQQYRQSLLKNAFNGELTKEWRSKHADTLPSENELLAQIQTTREQHHAQQLADWQTAVSQWEQNGKEGKKPSKPKAPTQAVKFEKNFAGLPRGWGMVKLENLASEYVLGKMLDKNKNKGKERLYLGNINVRWGYFEFSNAKTMKIEDDEIERYSVKYGDLIICEGGEPGRCAVWKHEAEMFIQKALHRVRFPSYYSADFAFYYLSYAVKLPLVTDLLTGTTIKHLTGTALKNIPFPVCSINEQTQIVAILESKLTACDQLAAELAKQLKQAELLKQAVLKAAFSGNLLDK
ncbi:restriction endonuclease subunit S [Neisseria polysaccharea]|uniref:Restriction endonuclease subunit S n=1 Tax=Neisseria polysaccharea TaxID=489 RepID=A0ABV1JJK6_NEIPO